MGQKLMECITFVAICCAKINHKMIFIAKFSHHLSAYTARRASDGDSLVCPAHYGNGNKIAFALTYGLKKCCAFSANGRCIGGIFNVASCVNIAVLAKLCCPNSKMGIGRIGSFHRFFGKIHQHIRCHSNLL